MPSTHFRFPCPSCQHPLKVRREYVGKDVQCRHCSVTFRVVVPDDRALHPDGEDAFTVETVAPATGSPPPQETTIAVERMQWEQLQDELHALKFERGRSRQAGDRLGVLTAELEAARHEGDRLREQVAAVKDRATQAATLRSALTQLQSQNGRLEDSSQRA